MIAILNKLYQPWARWITPRAVERAEAFQERAIRVMVAVLMVGTLLSLFSTLTVYRDRPEFGSYMAAISLVLGLLWLAGYFVHNRRVRAAGLLLVITLLLGAISVTMIDTYAGVLVAPTYMIVLMLAAVVLARFFIAPLAFISIVSYMVIAFYQEGTEPITMLDGTLVDAFGMSVNTGFFLVVEAMLLIVLRGEFDRRLGMMSESISQAEAAREEADRAAEIKSQFLASMSHELRTPMNAIIGYVDLMLTGMLGDFSDKQKSTLGHIKLNAQRLLEMINDTLDMSRIEAGRVSLNISQIVPREVVTNTVESMASLIQKKGLALHMIINEDTPNQAVGDVNKLQQVIINLVGNAIKFTSTGSVTVKVGEARPEWWYVEVIDTGIGIPRDAQENIFDKFYQVDSSNSRSFEGTGLGLAITKRLVEYMNGIISVNSIPGEGSTFRIEFPTQIQEATAESEPVAEIA